MGYVILHSPRIRNYPKPSNLRTSRRTEEHGAGAHKLLNEALIINGNKMGRTISAADVIRTKKRKQQEENGRGNEGKTTSSSSGKKGSLKQQLRGKRRFLQKALQSSEKGDTSKEEIIASLRRQIADLEKELQEKELAQKERDNAIKYHKIKFFERQKLTRLEKKVRREIRDLSEQQQQEGEDQDSKHNGKKKITAMEELLQKIHLDQHYVKHYPNQYRYVSLFTNNKDEALEQRNSIREQLASKYGTHESSKKKKKKSKEKTNSSFIGGNDFSLIKDFNYDWGAFHDQKKSNTQSSRNNTKKRDKSKNMDMDGTNNKEVEEVAENVDSRFNTSDLFESSKTSMIMEELEKAEAEAKKEIPSLSKEKDKKKGKKKNKKMEMILGHDVDSDDNGDGDIGTTREKDNGSSSNSSNSDSDSDESSSKDDGKKISIKKKPEVKYISSDEDSSSSDSESDTNNKNDYDSDSSEDDFFDTNPSTTTSDTSPNDIGQVFQEASLRASKEKKGKHENNKDDISYLHKKDKSKGWATQKQHAGQYKGYLKRVKNSKRY